MNAGMLSHTVGTQSCFDSLPKKSENKNFKKTPLDTWRDERKRRGKQLCPEIVDDYNGCAGLLTPARTAQRDKV